jgi:twitching motility protein PilT
MLAESLEAVVSQTLLKKKGGGRVAAHEILIGTPAVRNLIREAKLHQIPSMMQTGGRVGMQTLDAAIGELVKKGLVDASVLPPRPAAAGAAA